jgi:hypothetical protein
LDTQVKDGLYFQRSVTDAVFQGYAVQEFHDDEGLSIFLADFVNRANVRVI